MKRDIFKARITVIISVFVMWMVAIMAAVLYFITNYFIYFFLAATSAFLASTNTFFLLLRYIDLLSKEPKVKKVQMATAIIGINALRIFNMLMSSVSFPYCIQHREGNK